MLLLCVQQQEADARNSCTLFPLFNSLCVLVCVLVCARAYVHVHVCAHTHVCTCVCLYVYICTCECTHTHVCCVCVHVCMRVRMRTCHGSGVEVTGNFQELVLSFFHVGSVILNKLTVLLNRKHLTCSAHSPAPSKVFLQ